MPVTLRSGRAAPGPRSCYAWSWVHCRARPADTAAYSAPGWYFLSGTSGQNGYGRCSASSTGLSPPHRACHLRQYGSSSDGCTRYPPKAPASLAAYPHLRDWPPSEHRGPVPEKNNPDTGRVVSRIGPYHC